MKRKILFWICLMVSMYFGVIAGVSVAHHDHQLFQWILPGLMFMAAGVVILNHGFNTPGPCVLIFGLGGMILEMAGGIIYGLNIPVVSLVSLGMALIISGLIVVGQYLIMIDC